MARLRHRKSEQVSRHAHGFLPQTLADLGLVGAGVALALLAAWIAAAARTTGLYPRLRRRAPRLLGDRRDWDPERIALVALTLTAVVFGMQSAIDWTWFVPGPAVMALTAAGFVAGRGPVRAGVGPAAPEAVATEPGDELREDEPRLRVLGARLRRPSLPRVVAAAGVLLAALLCAWALWQPERSERLGTRALELIEQRDFSGAIREAEAAEDADPLSPRPLLIRAAAETASGRERRALGTLERTVLRFPGEPQTWLRLASFQLGRLDRPARALETVRAALYLDPKSKAARRVFFDARARQREQRAARRVEPPRRTAPSAP